MVVGRTLEFGQPLDSQIAIWPAGIYISGSSTSGAPLRYRSRYGFAGATAGNHSEMIVDRLNEKGLNVGLFISRATPNTPPQPRPAQGESWPLSKSVLGFLETLPTLRRSRQISVALI